MKREDVFPSKYLSKDELHTPVLAIMRDVELREVMEGEPKPVLEFESDTTPMIVNQTNWMTIEEAYGQDSRAWRGKEIEIYFDPNVMFGKKRTGGIRVRAPGGEPSATLRPAPAKGTPTRASVMRAFEAAVRQADGPETTKEDVRGQWEKFLSTRFPNAKEVDLTAIDWEQAHAELDAWFDDIPF